MPSKGARIAPRIIVSVFVLALGASLAAPASAENRSRVPLDPTYPHITVPSQYDPADTVSAAVRRTPHGDEVRLPGGTWVPCGFNCYFTLRNATVDFWRRYDVFPQ